MAVYERGRTEPRRIMPAAIVNGSAHWHNLKVVVHLTIRKHVAEKITSENANALYSYIENKLAK